MIIFTTKTVGSATNYSLSASGSSAGDFWGAASGATLSGGTDNGYTTMYDTGNVTVNVTINGTPYSKSSVYGQTSTSASIATDLANKINSDTTLNQLLVANPSAGVLNLTTKATGNGTNYPLSVTSVTNSPYFSAGSTSFPATPSGATLTPGQNGIIYDTGTVKVTITGFTPTPYSKTVNYSQGSSPTSIVSSITGALNADPLSPVIASASGGTVNLTADTLGAGTNYGVAVTSATTLPAYFAQPSFSGSAVSLSGGQDPSPASLAMPLSTFSSYDAMGDLLQVTQGQQTRTYQYDSLRHMTSACVPERNNQCSMYTYKDFGGLATNADPRSITTTYSYDTLNRLHTVTYSDSTPTVTYTYGAAGAGNNAAGRLTNISNSSAAEAYTYDKVGRVTQCVKTIGGQSYTTSYHYNTSGQLDYMTYPSGHIVYHDHDAIGRLSQIRGGGLTVFSIGSFNAAGEILSTTYGNGMTATYTYNNQLQLASILASNSSGAVLNLSCSYGGANDNGQISGITDAANPARSTSYLYDELGRLSTAQTADLASANTWKLLFSYDRYGNRLSEIPVAGTASMPMNEVVVDPTTNRLTNLAYDADGNVINDNQHTYAYNALNQITSVDGTNNTYAYDPSGLRVNKNGTIYIYSGTYPIAEYASGAAANSPSVEYGYVGGRLVASIASGVITYYYGDHLSTRVQTDASGTVTRSFGHFPFGETWYETAANKWKFTTYERDAESGLDYASARYDSSQFGRFTSRDPLSGDAGNPQSRNRYTYVMNDPINLTDPTGLLASKWDMCLYDDQGNPTKCFGLPTASKEMTEGELFYDVQVAVAFMFNNCTTTVCGVIYVNDNTNPGVLDALQRLETTRPTDLVNQDIYRDNTSALPVLSLKVGITPTFWSCFSSPTCDPRTFLQPAVSRSLGSPKIPTRRLPPPRPAVPAAMPATDFEEGTDQLEPVPLELLMPRQYGLYAINP